MYGLLMMRYYMEEIFDGKKDYDARLYSTPKRGRIALVDSSSFKVHGVADLTKVSEITYEEFVTWHRTGPFSNSEIAPFASGKTCYAYNLENIRRLVLPVKIPKDPDAHMWVEISDNVVKTFDSQKTLF